MPGITTPQPQLAVKNAVQLPLSQESLATINAHLNALSPQEILQWGIAYLPRLYQTTAFGLSGLVAIDMLSKITDNSPPLIFIDTLHHFPETYDLVERVKERYGVDVEVWKPEGCETADEFKAKYGENLWERKEQLYDYLVKVMRNRDHYMTLSST